MRRSGGTWHGNRYSVSENSSTFRLIRSSRPKPKGGRGQHSYGSAPGDVSVAPGSGSDPSRGLDGVAGHEAVGPTFARSQGEQEAERR